MPQDNPMDVTAEIAEEMPPKAAFSFRFPGKRFAVLIGTAMKGQARFRLNQMKNWAGTLSIRSDHPELYRSGNLELYVGRDSKGLLRGGDLPWQYMQGLCDDQKTDTAKRAYLAQTLAQLPPRVSFNFKADPELRDREFVREAFARAGFEVKTRTTLIYTGPEGIDPVEGMKPDMRTKVRKARRELEFTDMDVDSFFDHYERHLDGKHSHFFLEIDRELIRGALSGESPHAEIIAVRRKAANDNKQSPIEAAAIVSTGTDGYCKMLRISFRRVMESPDAQPPHQHAYKMILAEAMKRANDRHLPLDVDGFTAGGSTLYSRAGVFKPVVHDEYMRLTPAAAINCLTQRIQEFKK